MRPCRLRCYCAWFVMAGCGLVDAGKFRLHKFEQPIGEESQTISHEASKVELRDDFLFTDRGTKVPITTTFSAADDYTPEKFTITGSSSRYSKLDAEISVSGASAQIRENQSSQMKALPSQFFTINGYSPAAMQMLLLRYWKAHGSPSRLALLPSGEVQITDRGPETVSLGEKKVALERYSI